MAAVLLCQVSPSSARPPSDGVVSEDAIDIEACGVWHGGRSVELDAPRMWYALGTRSSVANPATAWSAGAVAASSAQDETFIYRVAFREPIAVGAVLSAAGQVARLKAGALYPGDPFDAEQWEAVRTPSGTPPRIATFERTAETRAMLFTDARRRGRSSIAPIRIFADRLANLAPYASVVARTEYISDAPARAADVADGTGRWASAGPNVSGFVTAPPISDLHPQWYVLAWDEPRTLTGFYMLDNFTEFRVESFDGPATVSPLASLESEWRRMREDQYDVRQQPGRWIGFHEPLTTAGVRFLITRAGDRPEEEAHVARLDSLLAIGRPGDRDADRTGDPGESPFGFVCASPIDGDLTVVVNDESGYRVRNLLARTPRPAGEHHLAWDLLDERGDPVRPGRYRWQAIVGPPLELRYELSTYPNVSVHHPENTAWLNGPHGPGGWLADHSAPNCVATTGDQVFFGAPVAESGVAFIACDISGRKQWGIRGFAAWSGAAGMAADGGTVFVHHPGRGIYGARDAGADRIWAVDIESRKWRTLLTERDTSRRRRGISAMAARNGVLALAINAGEDWLENAISWDDVVIESCIPFYREQRRARIKDEIVPNPRDDFLRLFRLKGTPPGFIHPAGTGLIRLESTFGPEHRQHILLVFREPVAIGSCVFPQPRDVPYRVRLSALRPEVSGTPDPAVRENWLPFETSGDLPWNVAVAPPNLMTRALLVTFALGEDDLFDDMLSPAAEARDPQIGGMDLLDGQGRSDASGGQAWKGYLDGMRLLRRRFRNRLAGASVHVNSGRVDDQGVWHAKSPVPLSSQEPAVYMLEWEKPIALRGLAIKEIDAARTLIDVFTGPEGVSASLESDAHWEQVADYVSRRRTMDPSDATMNARARYLDGVVDFGRETLTRAVRLRVVQAWPDRSDPAHCRIEGVAPLEYLGGEAEVERVVSQRIELRNGQSGQLLDELPVATPTQLAYAPDGVLYAVSDGRVVVVDTADGTHRAFPVTTVRPGALACDRHGNLYVYDAAPERRVVHVYRPDGSFIRRIGEPGGYAAGPWNPMRFNGLGNALAVDREDKLWIVDRGSWPKRISCWSTDGTFLRDYLGPTQYGGGGVLDPADRRRMFYGPLEFELDWERGTSRLKNLTWTGPTPAGEQPVHVNDRTYLVTRQQGTVAQRCAIVYLYEDGRLRPCAAMGLADAFPLLQDPAVLGLLDGRSLDELQFLWTDRSGDGAVQADEVAFSPRTMTSLSRFDERLTIHAGLTAFEVERFLPNGVPAYRMAAYPPPQDGAQGSVYRLKDGNFYRMGHGYPEAGIAPDGTLLWTYPNEGAGVHSRATSGPYTPGQIASQFYMIGHETAAAGDLGEFFVVNSNFGTWNIWTADGLLAGRIFQDQRDGRRVSWSMHDNTRGLRLDRVTVGEEHFSGSFIRCRQSGRYYAVAGQHHASVVDVRGLDEFRRSSGEFVVSDEDLSQAHAWRRTVAMRSMVRRPCILDVYALEAADVARRRTLMTEVQLPADPHHTRRSATLAMGHDAVHLYVRVTVRGAGPFVNTGRQWDRLFQTGAAVDLLFGLDTDADPARNTPVAGDKRLLVAMFEGTPAAVLYEAVSPDVQPAMRWEVVSPVGRTVLDSVRKLSGARIEHVAEEDGYALEMTLPLAELGLDPVRHGRMRFDWGILETDAEGSSTLRRSYWANPHAPTVADAPSEARLEPSLWGWARLPGRDRSRPQWPDMTNGMSPGGIPGVDELQLDDL